MFNPFILWYTLLTTYLIIQMPAPANQTISEDSSSTESDSNTELLVCEDGCQIYIPRTLCMRKPPSDSATKPHENLSPGFTTIQCLDSTKASESTNRRNTSPTVIPDSEGEEENKTGVSNLEVCTDSM